MSYLPNLNSTPSVGNSTTALLSGDATFTGAGELNTLPDVQVSCLSSSSGTLYFDFSVDGTNWGAFPTAGFSVAAGIHEFHSASKGYRYFRVRFINGSTAQTTFRVSTSYGLFRQPSAPLNQAISLDSDAILVRATFPWLDVSRGLTSGMSVIKKFGRNPAVGTSFAPITRGGQYRTPQPSAATTLRVKAGGNANDTAAGTGAREITLEGLGSDFLPLTETLATAGASASSATASTFTRLFRAYVSESGTYATASAGSHAGAITIENGSGGTDWVTIGATDFPKSQSEIAAYTIPSGYTGYVKLKNISVDSGKTVEIIFFAREGADATAAPYKAMRSQSAFAGVAGGTLNNLTGAEIPFGPYTGPCDVGFLAKVSTGTASVSAEFEIYLVDE